MGLSDRYGVGVSDQRWGPMGWNLLPHLAVDVRLAELDRLLLGDGGGPQALGQGM